MFSTLFNFSEHLEFLSKGNFKKYCHDSVGAMLKKQHRSTVDKCTEANALASFALLLATWVGMADIEMSWARNGMADPQDAPVRELEPGEPVCVVLK